MALSNELSTDAGQRAQGRRRKKRTIWCVECHAYLDFSDEEDVYYYGRGSRPTPVHCMGLSSAYAAQQWHGREHHGHVRHNPCPHCGADLGCDKCAGRWAEVICTRCTSWASIDGFIEHGPFLNTAPMIARRGGKRARAFDAYPVLWQHRYRQAHTDEPMPDPGAVDDMQWRFAP